MRNVPHRFRHLNLGLQVEVMFRKVSEAGVQACWRKCVIRMNFESWKPYIISSLFSPFHACYCVVEDVVAQFPILAIMLATCCHGSILPRWTLISLELWARINSLFLKLLLILVFYHTNQRVTNLNCTVFLWLSWLYTCAVIVSIASHLEDLNDISSWLKLGHTLYSGWSQKQHCILRSSSQTISYCFKRKSGTKKKMCLFGL